MTYDLMGKTYVRYLAEKEKLCGGGIIFRNPGITGRIHCTIHSILSLSPTIPYTVAYSVLGIWTMNENNSDYM